LRQPSAADELRAAACAQDFINDKGYTFLDIRTGKEYRSGNKLHWRAPRGSRAAEPS
jgi:hypothetical protein